MAQMKPPSLHDLMFLLGDKDVLIFCLSRQVEELEAEVAALKSAQRAASAPQAPPEGLKVPNEG